MVLIVQVIAQSMFPTIYCSYRIWFSGYRINVL